MSILTNRFGASLFMPSRSVARLLRMKEKRQAPPHRQSSTNQANGSIITSTMTSHGFRCSEASILATRFASSLNSLVWQAEHAFQVGPRPPSHVCILLASWSDLCNHRRPEIYTARTHEPRPVQHYDSKCNANNVFSTSVLPALSASSLTSPAPGVTLLRCLCP